MYVSFLRCCIIQLTFVMVSHVKLMSVPSILALVWHNLDQPQTLGVG